MLSRYNIICQAVQKDSRSSDIKILIEIDLKGVKIFFRFFIIKEGFDVIFHKVYDHINDEIRY